MSTLITILQLAGLALIILVVVGFAARRSLKPRSKEQTPPDSDTNRK